MDNVRNFFSGDDNTDREGLQALFVNELKGIYYTENQLIDALQEQADAATSDEVRNAFLQHQQETRGQVQRLEQIFNQIGVEADEMTCNAADGLIDDAQMVVSNTETGSLTRDAGLIIAGQKVEHHEIAAYGSLHTLARVLGHTQVAQLLEQSLQEEKTTDQKLTQLAESFVNDQAAGESNGNGSYRSGSDDSGSVVGSGSTYGTGSYGSGTTSGSGTYRNDPTLGGMTGV